MQRFFQFWRLCAAFAIRGSSSFANDWQWVIGVPIASFIGVYIAALRGATEVTTGHPILDAFIAALVAFVITWIVAFLIRMIKSAPELYFTEKDRADNLVEKITTKLKAIYDEKILSCNDTVTFVHPVYRARCFRLKVDNVGTSRLYQCEGWLESIQEMPHLSAARLFWIGIPEQGAVDLAKGIPRFLQLLKISDSNIVIPATYGAPVEQWPIDQRSKFGPGKYHFKVGIKGHDESETVFLTLELDWTGNWETASMQHVET
jgi:hypothetical protein